MSDNFEQWFESEFLDADLSQRETLKGYNNLKYGWNAALSSLQGEAVAEFGGHRHTPKDTTEFFGWMCDSNFRLKSGTKLFTYPPDSASKIAELESKLAKVEKDAELLAWFLETCSEEVALYISGDGQASADELKAAIQESKKGGA